MKKMILFMLICSNVFAQNFNYSREFSISSTNAPTARSNGGSATKNSLLYIFGGDVSGSNINNECFSYNYLQNTWTQINVPSNIIPRTHCTMVWVGSKLFIYGGASPSAQKFDDFIIYDSANNTWQNAMYPSGFSGKLGSKIIYTGTEIIIYGGSNGNTVYGGGKRFNVSTNTWGNYLSTTNDPGARVGYTCEWTGTEIIIWGGSTGVYASDPLATGGKIYNPQTDTWRNMSTLNIPAARQRNYHAFDGRFLYIWGGLGANGVTLNNGGVYDYTTDTWYPLTITNPLSNRYESFGAFIDGKMIMWGGYHYETSSAKGDGAVFNLTSTAITPKNTIDLQIYPNPNNGQFRIDLKDYQGFADICLSDNQGKEVFRENIFIKNQTLVNIPNLTKGVYILMVETKTGKSMQKLVIE